jgi:hypothetical protein
LYEQIEVVEQEQPPLLTDITETEESVLEEWWYLEEQDVAYTHIRYVQDPAMSKMVFTLMRGNDEAEMRFWKTLDNRGTIAALEAEWVEKWDILKIKSYYEWVADKYIVF